MTGVGTQNGFTLIELLVSLVLLGLMMTMMGMAIPVSMTGAARASALSNELGVIETTQHLLRREIGEMPPIMTGEGYGARSVFTGTPDTMRFVANPVAAQGGGGPGLVTLSARRNGSAMRLSYTMDGETRDLAANTERIVFSYYGAPAPGKIPAWQDDWKDAPHPPSLVRIQIEPGKDAMPWPDLVIAVKAGPLPP